MPEALRNRIAIFLPNLGGGGAERVALVVANDLVNQGHEVDLVLIREGGELIPLLEPAVRVIEFSAPRMIASLIPLVRYLRRRQPDSLLAIMWPTSVIAMLAHGIARSRARLVTNDQVALSQQYPTGIRNRLVRWTTRLFYPQADARVVCSALAADDLAAISGVPRDRIEVIYNPISPPATIATDPKVEQLWGEGGRRIITVGSLKEQKNHALLLRAFARLSDKNVKLMILGEGHLRAELDKLARALGIAERLILPGFSADPWPYFASADLFVLSSDYEGFGIVVTEAMYAGLPVVSTDCVSGPGEILAHGEYGALVPVGDEVQLANAIERALGQPREPDRMRKRALVISGPHVLKRYAELLTA